RGEGQGAGAGAEAGEEVENAADPENSDLLDLPPGLQEDLNKCSQLLASLRLGPDLGQGEGQEEPMKVSRGCSGGKASLKQGWLCDVSRWGVGRKRDQDFDHLPSSSSDERELLIALGTGATDASATGGSGSRPGVAATAGWAGPVPDSLYLDYLD
ncbi:unnamed protein product, partial [Discosporangium mesarthrocarpum]